MMHRSGVKLVEVLIVIVIVGVLAGLMLPAQQAAREASRRGSDAAPASTAQQSEQQWGRSAEEKSLPNDRRTASRFGLANDAYATALQIDDEAAAAAARDEAERKIIYEAQMALVVDNVAETETAIVKLLKDYDGYVAESSVSGRQGEQLTGQWRVRIPVDKFQEFLAAVAKLGVTENRQQTAQDVSEEFVDLEARIANQKELEKRVVALLDKSSDKIGDMIQVEQQLARVRGEIEQMEGRLRYLTHRTELTTVAITAREEHDYVPPEAPTFKSRIAAAWADSLNALRVFGERLVVAFVAAAPWIAVVGACVVPVAWVVGRRVRARRRKLDRGGEAPLA